MLRACRRVVKDEGRLAFSVIAFAAGLTSAEYKRAEAAAPPCTATDTPYPELIEQAGFSIIESIDVTDAFKAITTREFAAFRARADHLRELLGAEEFDERVALRHRRVAALADGLIRRTLYVAHARVN